MLVNASERSRVRMNSETFGQALRRLRGDGNKSLRGLAGITGYDYTYLSKVENGQQQGSRDLAEACDQALEADGQLVARYEATQTETEDIGTMLRRTFLLGSAGVLAANSLGIATPARTHRIGANTLADLRSVAASYRRSYRAVPAGQLLPAAQAHLELAMSMRPAQQPEAERIELISVVGEMAALAAVVVLLDLNKPDAAQAYLEVAWQAAKAADSPELQAIILAGRSFVSAYGPSRNHRQGLEYAELACEIAQTGACHETRGWVAAVASERHASLNDLASCQRRMDDSRAALDALDDGDPQWLGLGGFNATKLLAYEGGNMVRLGRWSAAGPVLDAAVDQFGDDMVRHRCTALLDRAEARLGAAEARPGTGDVDAACIDASSALVLAVEMQHGQSLRRLDALSRRVAATGAAAGRALRREMVSARADTAGVFRMES